MVKVSDLFQVKHEEQIEILKLYNRTHDTVQKDIGIIKEWIATQKHFPKINFFNDGKIRKLLINCRMSIEKTKERIDMFYTSKSLTPELFEGTEPSGPRMTKLYETVVFFPLKNLSTNYDRIYLHCVISPEAEDVEHVDNLFHLINMANMTLDIEYAVHHSLIVDFKNVTLNMIGKFSPLLLKKSLDILARTYGGKVGCAHFLNCPSYMDKFLQLGKACLKPKIANRYHVHDSLESLHKLVPKEILPKEYGGDQKSMYETNDEWRKLLLQFSPTVELLNKARVNEKLRVGKPPNDDFLGFQGNFRQLEFF